MTYEHAGRGKNKGYVIKKTSAYNTQVKGKFVRKPKGQRLDHMVLRNNRLFEEAENNSSIDEVNIERIQKWYKEQSSPSRYGQNMEMASMLQHY